MDNEEMIHNKECFVMYKWEEKRFLLKWKTDLLTLFTVSSDVM